MKPHQAARRRFLLPPRARLAAELLASAVLVTVALTGCAAAPAPTPGPTLPPVAGGLVVHLGGAYDPPVGVEIVARDSTEAPAP
ncbi:MAG: hypothetical protein ABWY68_10860, partial [Cryobacterium sp.]